ncbi:phosphatidate cytidylyltransferase, partial [Ligilactobacillus salivarius]|nr:phosphatidate cytidylyltransferase [Ligilactobacillus salivarius]
MGTYHPTCYLWGKSCGRRKVVPKVSPGKTLEGLMGGVITIMIASLIIGPLLTPLNTLQALLAGLLIGISGFCGDVVMSAIKRDIGVKDSGKLLPGHGGLLDRIYHPSFSRPLCPLTLHSLQHVVAYDLPPLTHTRYTMMHLSQLPA